MCSASWRSDGSCSTISKHFQLEVTPKRRIPPLLSAFTCSAAAPQHKLKLTSGFEIWTFHSKAHRCLSFQMRNMKKFYPLFPPFFFWAAGMFWRKFQADYLKSVKAIKELRAEYESRIPQLLLKHCEVPTGGSTAVGWAGRDRSELCCRDELQSGLRALQRTPASSTTKQYKAHGAQLILAEETEVQTSSVRCSQNPLLCLPGCSLSISPHFTSLSALSFLCFSPLFFSFFFFCGYRLWQRWCCLPDVTQIIALTLWLEMGDAENPQPSPFAIHEGAGAMDLVDSVGSCSHIL